MLEANGIQTRLLARLLEASELRAKVVSSNIANENTPGYTRKVVHFEELLREALSSGGTDSLDSIAPQVADDEVSPARPDGNNVTLELELSTLRENRLLYETYASILNGHFEMIRAAIQDSR